MFKTSIQLYSCLIWKHFGISHGKIRSKPWMRLRNASVVLKSSLFTPSLSVWFPIIGSGWAGTKWRLALAVLGKCLRKKLSELLQGSSSQCTGCTFTCKLESSRLGYLACPGVASCYRWQNWFITQLSLVCTQDCILTSTLTNKVLSFPICQW